MAGSVAGRLRAIARRSLRDEQNGISTTSVDVVDEAVLRTYSDTARFKNEGALTSAIIRRMNQVLIDNARRKRCDKRPPEHRRDSSLDLEQIVCGQSNVPAEIEIRESLEALGRLHPTAYRAVELRMKGVEESERIAETLQVSGRTVERYLAFASDFLACRLL